MENNASVPPAGLTAKEGLAADVQTPSPVRWDLYAVLGVWLACGFTSLFWPMARDQGAYAYEGWRVLHFELPFKALWETKGPGIQYINALAQFAFGENMWGIRALDMLCQLAVALLLFHMLRRLGGDLVAGLAGCFFLLGYYDESYWNQGLCESFALPLIMAGLWLTDREPGRLRSVHSLLGGLCFGLTSWLKPHFFLLAGAPLLLFVTWRLRRQVKTGWLLRNALFLFVGTFLGLVSLGAWAWVTGAWTPMKEILLDFNMGAYREAAPMAFGRRMDVLHEYLVAKHPLATVLVVAGAVMLLARRRLEYLGLLYLGIAAFGVFLAGGKYHSCHWIVVFPCAAAIGGWAAAELVSAWAKAPSRNSLFWAPCAVGIVLVLVALLGPGWTRMRDLAHVIERLTGKGSWASYHQRFTSTNGSYSFPAAWDAAEYASQTTRPDDFVLVWAYDPLINYLAQRRSPTRFSYPFPLIRPEGNDHLNAWRAEFMEGLRRHPPALILVGCGDYVSIVGRSSKKGVDEFPAFKSFLLADYRLNRTTDYYEMWTRIKNR